jgi:hypothetical protein
MNKNPYTVIRKVFRVVGYAVLGLIFLALIAALLISIFTAGGGTWRGFFLTLLIVVGGLATIFGVIVGFFWLLGKLIDWWKDQEQRYAEKQRKKLFDAGTPALDPRPLDWAGIRMSYYPTSKYGIATFDPRKYYETDEKKYLDAWKAAQEEEE